MKDIDENFEVIDVVNYLRVSTNHEDQRNSIENQKSFFDYYIKDHPEWNFVNSYVDEGITGTNTKKRIAFNQMIEDAKQEKFKMIITKEVSRFARNTLDAIKYTRLLKNLNIGVYFLLEEINTMDDNAESRLTNLASSAQEESHRTSRRVKFGIHSRMKQNFVFGNHVYGYNLQKGKLTVNQEEAEIVRLIFKLYMDGKGINGIRKELEKRAILSPNGLKQWKDSSIQAMLSNEKYIGTLKQHKQITTNFLEHTRVKNDGTKEEFIIKENNHEPIISKEDFEAVQKEIENRRGLSQDSRKYSNRYCFSSKIICKSCNATFQRRYWNGKHEQKNIVWQCKNNIYFGKRKINAYGEESGCDAKGIHEEILKSLFLVHMNEIVDNKEQHIVNLKCIVKEAISNLNSNQKQYRDLERSVNKLESKRHKLLELYTDEIIKKEQFTSSNNEYTIQILNIKEELLKIKEISSKRDELTNKMNMIDKNIEKLVRCEEFSDPVCKNVTHHIDVYSRDEIHFFFQINVNPLFFKLNIPVLSMQQGLLDLPALRELGPPALLVPPDLLVPPALPELRAPPAPLALPGLMELTDLLVLPALPDLPVLTETSGLQELLEQTERRVPPVLPELPRPLTV